jgi:hypothetical protein
MTGPRPRGFWSLVCIHHPQFASAAVSYAKRSKIAAPILEALS